jgi:hypothetical protein
LMYWEKTILSGLPQPALGPLQRAALSHHLGAGLASAVRWGARN